MWYVVDSHAHIVEGVSGVTKSEAKEAFLNKMESVTGTRREWLWWKNKGYALRRKSR